MPLPPGEPANPEALDAWIREQTRAHDRYSYIYDRSEEHRIEHGEGCSVFPTGGGPTLGALVAAAGARRILELGCGLGYSTLWLARGSSPDGRVETIEQDLSHIDLARAHFEREGVAPRIEIHTGRGVDVLRRLSGAFDFIFCDSEIDEYLDDLDEFLRLLNVGGSLLTANLFLGLHSPDIPGLDQAAAYRLRIMEDPRLLTAFLSGGKALSVRIA